MKSVIKRVVPSICPMPTLRFIHEIEAVCGRRANYQSNERREIVQSRGIFELVFCTTGAQMMRTQLDSKKRTEFRHLKLLQPILGVLIESPAMVALRPFSCQLHSWRPHSQNAGVGATVTSHGLA